MQLISVAWMWLMAVSWLAAVVVWIIIARYSGSLPRPKQAKAIRLCGVVTIVICAAFPLALFGADFIGGRGPSLTIEDLHWMILDAAALSVLHSIPGLIVLICFFLYWKWQEYRVQDDWALAFAFVAVQAPNFWIMTLWVAWAILDEIAGRSEALLVTWLIPIKLIPITLPVGMLLGLAAFSLARRIRFISQQASN